ncbi:enterochelin esterase [Marinomonas sp. RS-M-Aa-14]|uniref:enterochelin esterase n=1 Tax=Marinomonas sp. RS-M-Aa-14 TaxID=3241169 RepID=UPI00390C7B12
MTNTNHPMNSLLQTQDVGSTLWWEHIQKIGTPLLQPNVSDQDCLATFLWKDSAGPNSNIEAVYIDLYSKTPHPTKQLTCFSHIKGTDVWYWETSLPKDWLGSYFLMPASKEQTPPDNKDPQAIRQWWIKLMGISAQADALNPIPPHSNGNNISLSAISLKNGKQDNTQRNAKEIQQAPTHTSLWHSEILNNSRRIWLHKTGTNTKNNLPVVLLFDGQYWATQMPICSDLNTLTATGELPPALYVFIDSINSSSRYQELGCNTDFWEAIEQELLPWVSTQFLITDDPHKTIVTGQSLGGLCAVYGALKRPHRFACAISQSGSFWWPNVDSTPGQGELIQELIAQGKCSTPIRFVIAAGCYEQDMLEVSKVMTNTLKNTGHHVRFEEFRGGHDWLCWRQSLLQSLSFAFST